MPALNFETVSLDEVIRLGLIADPDPPHHPVILVVDDEHVIADTLATILKSHGYAAMQAYDAESAFALSRVIPPELLLTDVILREKNGIDLAIAIKDSVPDCKVLLFSGQAATANLLAEARHAGHDFTVLMKPLHPTDLLANIRGLDPKFQCEPASEIDARPARFA